MSAQDENTKSRTTDQNAGRVLEPAPTRPADLCNLALGNDEGSPAKTTGYSDGWQDCKNTILELLHAFEPDGHGLFRPMFHFIDPGDLEKICFAIAAQEPESDRG